MFFLIAFSIYAGAHLYIGSRIIPVAKLPVIWKSIAWVGLGLHTLLVPAMFFLRSGGYWPPWLEYYYFAVFTGAGFMAILFPLLLARDAAWLLTRIARSAAAKAVGGKPLRTDPARRRFMLNALNTVFVGAASGVAGVGVSNVRRPPAVVHVTAPVPGLPEQFDGFTIAQITDVHLSPTVRGDYLSLVVDIVNGLDADIVAVTGDMVDGYVNELAGDVESLSRLKAREGAFFVTGNHEYYWNGPAWVDKMRGLGLTALVNQSVAVERGGATALIAGLPDHMAGKDIPGHAPDPRKIIKEAPAHGFKIMLAHQPRSAIYSAEAGFDIMICGHTHGGQFFPWNYIIPLFHPVPTGLSVYRGMTVYASPGTAYWGPPMRAGTRSEITLITLARAGGGRRAT
ncbi:MAG: metallophosphoesterase [Nitrospinae bacterium]|nr:metallophosphoesterase [Nitrospinota bacterium]